MILKTGLQKGIPKGRLDNHFRNLFFIYQTKHQCLVLILDKQEIIKCQACWQTLWMLQENSPMGAMAMTNNYSFLQRFYQFTVSIDIKKYTSKVEVQYISK